MLEQSPRDVRDGLKAWTALGRDVERGSAIPFVADSLTTQAVLRALLAKNDTQ